MKHVSLLLSVFALGLLAAGCEGPVGEPGEGVESLDLTPPEISYVYPTRSDTVITDTFTVAVDASDNDDIDYIDFYLDNQRVRRGVLPYQITWSFAGRGLGYGVYPISARATDPTNNRTSTPTLLVYHVPPFGQRTLEEYETGDTDPFTLPSGDGDRYLNVRFTALDSCDLVRARIHVLDAVGETITGTSRTVAQGCDLYLHVWDSGADGHPDPATGDSLLIAAADLVSAGWVEVDLSSLARREGGSFHIGLSPPAGDYDTLLNNDRAIALAVTQENDTLDVAANHRTQLYRPGFGDSGWGTVQEVKHDKLDLHLEVVVDYGALDRTTQATLEAEATRLRAAAGGE